MSDQPIQTDQSNQTAQTNQPTQAPQDKVVQVGKYQVKVVRNLCISAATCVALSPSVFQLDNENKAIVKEEANDLPEHILMAAQSCPTKAIIITDNETGKQVWPE